MYLQSDDDLGCRHPSLQVIERSLERAQALPHNLVRGSRLQLAGLQCLWEEIPPNRLAHLAKVQENGRSKNCTSKRRAILARKQASRLFTLVEMYRLDRLDGWIMHTVLDGDVFRAIFDRRKDSGDGTPAELVHHLRCRQLRLAKANRYIDDARKR